VLAVVGKKVPFALLPRENEAVSNLLLRLRCTWAGLVQWHGHRRGEPGNPAAEPLDQMSGSV